MVGQTVPSPSVKPSQLVRLEVLLFLFVLPLVP